MTWLPFSRTPSQLNEFQFKEKGTLNDEHTWHKESTLRINEGEI